MLFLSRRANQKFSFPEVDIEIHFTQVSSDTANIRIDAPMHLQIDHDEADDEAASTPEASLKELARLPSHVRHAIRNELQMISVGLHLFKEQIHLGLEDEANETFETVMTALRSLDANDVLQRPVPQSFDTSTAKPATILIVEHEANERSVLASALRRKGYDVATAADGEEALDYLAEKETPDTAPHTAQ